MTRMSGGDRIGAVPAGLLGMLALVAAIEGWLGRHEAELIRPIQAQWREQGRASRAEAVGAGVLCLGDSLVTYGVIPSALERRLGVRAYNLALGGGLIPADYFLLRRALERGARPKALVIDGLPLQFRVEPGARARAWSDLLTGPELADLAWSSRDPALLASVLISWRLRSYQYRLEIREAILGGIAGRSTSEKHLNRVASRNMGVNRGALIAPAGGEFRVNPKHLAWVYPDPPSLARVNREYLDRLLDLAEARAIPVFWVLTPVSEAVEAAGAAGSRSEAGAGLLREAFSKHAGVTVIDGRRRGYPDWGMEDSIHLNRSGATVFSADLADAIGRSLDRGRRPEAWVDLPDFGPRRRDFRVEDLAESRAALAPTLTR